jgi:hypothetical protein
MSAHGVEVAEPEQRVEQPAVAHVNLRGLRAALPKFAKYGCSRRTMNRPRAPGIGPRSEALIDRPLAAGRVQQAAVEVRQHAEQMRIESEVETGRYGGHVAPAGL